MKRPSREPDLIYYSSHFWFKEKVMMFTGFGDEQMSKTKVINGDICTKHEGTWIVVLANYLYVDYKIDKILLED